VFTHTSPILLVLRCGPGASGSSIDSEHLGSQNYLHNNTEALFVFSNYHPLKCTVVFSRGYMVHPYQYEKLVKHSSLFKLFFSYTSNKTTNYSKWNEKLI
jgi:hypothetical protein